jgi:hypothetical protein
MNELTITPPSVIGELSRSEIQQQVATARLYPRDPQRFERQALILATGSKETAADCLYGLPIEGKIVEGPSVRFAEIVASTWGNCRAGARIIEEGHEHVVAQGVFHDLESNVTTTFETRRRIIDKKGRRYSSHMIITTCNAACAIALRQAVFKGVPKPYWSPIYESARKLAIGDDKSLPDQRKKAIAAFKKYKISEERLLNALEIVSVDEIGFDELAKLRGLFTALKDGELTPEEAFPPPSTSSGSTGSGDAKPSTVEEFAMAAPHKVPMSTQPQAPDVASAAEAYELGRQAHAKGANQKQWPGIWRDQANIEAWIAGWDAAEAENEAPPS